MRSVLFLARIRIGGNAAHFSFIQETNFWGKIRNSGWTWPTWHDCHVHPLMDPPSSGQMFQWLDQKPALSPLDLEWFRSMFWVGFGLLTSPKSSKDLISSRVVLEINHSIIVSKHEMIHLMIWDSVPGSNEAGPSFAGCQRGLGDLVQHPKSCLDHVRIMFGTCDDDWMMISWWSNKVSNKLLRS